MAGSPNYPIVWENSWDKPSQPKPEGYTWWDKGKYHEDYWADKKVQPEEEHEAHSNEADYVAGAPKGYKEGAGVAAAAAGGKWARIQVKGAK